MNAKEAILRIKDHKQIHFAKEKPNCPLIIKALDMAINALEKDIAKPPIHKHEEYPEHDWIRDEDGEIDMWAMSYEYHNGPRCKRCSEAFCEHCNPNWAKEGPCIVDTYYCPSCGEEISRWDKRCKFCGQLLNESEEPQ